MQPRPCPRQVEAGRTGARRCPCASRCGASLGREVGDDLFHRSTMRAATPEHTTCERHAGDHAKVGVVPNKVHDHRFLSSRRGMGRDAQNTLHDRDSKRVAQPDLSPSMGTIFAVTGTCDLAGCRAVSSSNCQSWLPDTWRFKHPWFLRVRASGTYMCVVL